MPKKVQTIQDWEVLLTAQQARSFVSLCDAYNKHMVNFWDTTPLDRLLERVQDQKIERFSHTQGI